MSIVNISLPGYNAGKYLRKSVESIHKQTNTSSELFIIDDGSTDGRIDFLIHVTDGRIYLMKRNHSYIATLNYGFSISCGKCIARMDFDNKMFPARFSVWVRPCASTGRKANRPPPARCVCSRVPRCTTGCRA